MIEDQNGNFPLYHNSGECNSSQFLLPNTARRLDRLTKNGIVVAMEALTLGEIKIPDSFISGTGKGNIKKINQFLQDIVAYKETALNPSVFIHSTYNNLNGYISIETSSFGYNITFVSSGYTLPNVLIDAQMYLQEHPNDTILIGVFDEETRENADLFDRAGSNLIQFGSNRSSKIIRGEGISFFVLSNQLSKTGLEIRDIKTHINFDDLTDITDKIKSLDPKSLIILGYNNEEEKNWLYGEIIKLCKDRGINHIPFKNLCGEYETSGGIALHMAKTILENLDQNVYYSTADEINNCLIINHFENQLFYSFELKRTNSF